MWIRSGGEVSFAIRIHAVTAAAACGQSQKELVVGRGGIVQAAVRLFGRGHTNAAEAIVVGAGAGGARPGRRGVVRGGLQSNRIERAGGNDVVGVRGANKTACG